MKDFNNSGKEISRQDIKRIQLMLLKEIDDFCNENKITYYLSYGSLLGAIRHGGFIPWDDDVDVSMPRAEYNKFIANFKNKENAKLLSIEVDPEYIYPFAKLVNPNTELIEECWPNYSTGIYVDIFPLEDVPQNKIIRKIYISFFRKILYFASVFMTAKKGNPKSLYNKPRIFIAKIIKSLFFWSRPTVGYKFAFYLINLFKPRKTSFCYNISGDSPSMIIPKEVLADTIPITFENMEVKTMKNWDQYLKIMYNDYMTLPPPEKRVEKHCYKTWWK